MNFKGVETTNQVTYGGVLCNSGLIVVKVAYEGFVDMGDPKVTMVVSIRSRGHP